MLAPKSDFDHGNPRIAVPEICRVAVIPRDATKQRTQCEFM
jgi:hypothetical protein